MERKPKILTFYTQGTEYEREANELAQTAKAFGYEIKTVPVHPRDTWERNCCQKARVCRDEVCSSSGPVLFLDADCRIAQKLPLFSFAGHADILLDIVKPDDLRPGWFCHRYKYHIKRRGGMWNSGIMLIQPNAVTRELMEAWVDLCHERPMEWDQINLQLAWYRTGCKARVKNLPVEYKAGRSMIHHQSAFHRFWVQGQKRKPLRSVLLLGSGLDAPKWWARHGQRYKLAGFAITALNNAWRIPAVDDLEYWFHANDFYGDTESELGERPPCIIPGNEDLSRGQYEPILNRESNWFIKPHWTAGVRLSFLDTLCHLANEAIFDKANLRVHVAGCDMNYPKEGPLNFYGKGVADPLRFEDSLLDSALKWIEETYRGCGFQLWNATDSFETRLPFERGQVE